LDQNYKYAREERGKDRIREIDRRARRLNSTSRVEYDPKGKVVNSFDVASGWQRVVPDTISEQLYNGACSQAH